MTAKYIIQRALYPLTLTVAVGWAYLLLYKTNGPLWVIAAPLALVFITVAIAERVLPYRKTWNQSHGDILTDCGYITVNVLIREVSTVVFKLLLIWLAAALGTGSHLGLWPSSWHPIAQMIFALVIFDFFEYWFHRASHSFGFLWRFHAIHHSPQRLYFFNAARFHFIDWLALTAIEVVVLLAIGADTKLVALAVVFIQSHGLFQHSNIAIHLGWLNYLVSGPELHRWHHSKLIEESDTNFGNNVIVWDILFATYFRPASRQVGVIGLLNPHFPTSYWGQLKAAFARYPIDKPDDFYQREAHYLQQVADENANEQQKL